MSWFDTSGLASIAKSALKEAQKTIDKALDIKDNEVTATPTNTPIDTNDDFFGTWGLTQSGNVTDPTRTVESQEIITKSPTKSSKMTTSIWGSFTGSFFENSKELRNDSVDSLDDSFDLGGQQFKQSKLVVQHSEESYSAIPEENEPSISENVKAKKEFEQTDLSYEHNQQSKRTEKSGNNRLSVISTGSGKNSSESVEVLSGDTGCTTSPDSDIASLGLSVSASSSTQGLKCSESVEVLPESLTSPSSLEILGTSSNPHSQHTDEFVSPLDSPLIEANLSTSEKDSPDSIDVIPEEQEESSIAEDTSYGSISETTAATVLETVYPHLKPQKHFKELHDVSPVSDKSLTFAEPITRAPSRSGIILALNTHLIDTQPLGSSQDLISLIKNPNIIDIPLDDDSATSESQLENDEGSHSDRTVIASDNVMESSSDTSTTTESNSNLSYLKNMLADAMTEKSNDSVDVQQKSEHAMDLSLSMIDSRSNVESLENISITQLDMPHRETSPLSSESRSDLVKIGSDHTSGHTSGDEVETTTSSDIEIISSPNGDSSSTQSRQSPAKQSNLRNKHTDANVDVLLGKMTFKKIKGHNRELSEASSISDDSHSSEVDRLIKRVAEVTEILELRESKLIEVSRRNAELQEMNLDMRKQLDGFLTKQMESADLSQVTEEYTQRLSALEKRFQQAIREKDILRKQLEQSKQDAALRVSKGELESLVNEKDEIIKQLREEGEKLSKTQLQHSNIIKKLRAKEKEQEAVIKNLKENVEDLSSETERLKKSLAAKDEVERTQIEAIHQLTAKNKKMENEVMVLQGQVDDITQKFDTVKKSLDAAKKELVDKNRASSELQAREQMLQSLENEKKMTESQNEVIINQLDDLRLKLRDADQEFLKKEQMLRTENNELLRRLEDAERRNEELTQSILEVSKPLVRQLETLQSTHNMKVASFEKIEEGLLLKINELQGRLNTALENEKLSREESADLRRKLSSIETQFTAAAHEAEMLKMQMEQYKTEKIIAEQDFRRDNLVLQQTLQEEKEKNDNLTKELSSLKEELMTEKAVREVEKKSNLQEEAREKGSSKASPLNTGNTSPTLSLGRTSLSESLGSTFWSPDDQFDAGPAPRYTNMFEMQMLQTNLKQREGELQQLQWELNRREHERTLLNSEISSLMTRIESLESKVADHEKLTKQLEELKKEYDLLCQLYGEKVEENEELKLDLQDVKDMYKTQIDELLRQQKENS